MRFHTLLVLVFLSALTTGPLSPASAATPSSANSTATSAAGTLMQCPQGDGQTLGASLTITATILDGAGFPCIGVFASDVWADSAIPSTFQRCTPGSGADGPTNLAGQTTISGPLVGGGWTQSGLRVFAQGTPALGSPALAIDVNSPDINGDLIVDLCDVELFSQDYAGGYHFRSDFAFDGILNLSDVVQFSSHFDHQCPGSPPPPLGIGTAEIGIFFDTAGTVTSLVPPFAVPFSVYVVALNLTEGITGYEWGSNIATADPNLIWLTTTTYPVGTTINLGFNAGEVRTGTGGVCLNGPGPVVLAEYQMLYVGSGSQISLCLGPISGSSFGGPGYLSCASACDRLLANAPYFGCAVLNGPGPVATQDESWGSVKAHFGSE